MSKNMGMPIMEGLNTVDDLPYPISQAILFRNRIDSFNELPEDKKPPRDLWRKPHKLEEWFDDVFDRKRENKRETEWIDIDESEVE